MPSAPEPARIFIDLTHLGRHVTGIERVAIEQFEKVTFTGARAHHVRASGILSLILKQQFWLPILAVLYPRAVFVFPGFPPSPLFAFFRSRTLLYVHDLFLITRPADLAPRARLYMARPFAWGVLRLKWFAVNSEKTRAELLPFSASDAEIALYRPTVDNVFALTAHGRAARPQGPRPLRIAMLGTVEPRKNYTAALAILDCLADAGHPAAQLHIIGREGWGEAVAPLKEHPRVTIHGYLTPAGVKEQLEAADVYLCTSHDEGLGLPLLEAQYAGLAMVAPDRPVFREVLGTSATFIDPADAPAAARAIAALTAAPDWRGSSAQAALANVARWNGLAAADLAEFKNRFAPAKAGNVPA